MQNICQINSAGSGSFQSVAAVLSEQEAHNDSWLYADETELYP